MRGVPASCKCDWPLAAQKHEADLDRHIVRFFSSKFIFPDIVDFELPQRLVAARVI